MQKLTIPRKEMQKKAEELAATKTEAKIHQAEEPHTGRLLRITREGHILIHRS